MARDEGLKELLTEDLGRLSALSTEPMFGGLAWLLEGHLLLCARHDGMLARLGAGHDGWALGEAGIDPMMAGTRPMRGWVRAGPDACGDDALRKRLVEAALRFVRTLPAKERGEPAPSHRSRSPARTQKRRAAANHGP